MTLATIRLSLKGDDGVPLVARIMGGNEPILEEAVVPARGVIDVTVQAGDYAIQLILPSGGILLEYRSVTSGGLVEVPFDARGRSSTGLSGGERFDLQAAVADAGADAIVRSAARSGAQAGGEGTATVETNEGPGPAGRKAIRSGPYDGDRFGAARPAAANGKPYSSRRTVGLGPQGGPRGGRPSVARTVSGSEPPHRARLSFSTIRDLEGVTAWTLATTSPKRWTAGKVIPSSSEPAAVPLNGVELWTIDSSDIPIEERVWATVDGPGGLELASIPLPWPVCGGQASVNVLVDPRVGGAAMTSVALTDSVYGGLLSYVAAGRISMVVPMIRRLEEDGAVEAALYGDDPNPLAVCIVAISLMATATSGLDGKWDGWLRDLMDRNPDIPDCAIVYARSLVIRPGELDDRGEAAKALRRAFDAGIPYFSTTLQLMRDMLFAGARRDSGLAAALDQVRPVVARCDPRGMTTVLRYPAGAE